MDVATATSQSDRSLLRQPTEKTVTFRPPYLVGLLLLVNVAAFALGLTSGLSHQIRTFGFQPAHPTLQTLLTSMFVHVGFLHIVNNMLVLMLVGAAIEGQFGHLKFAVVYVLSGLAATGLHTLAAANPQAFLAGASGAISGLMGMAFRRLFPSESEAAVKLLAWFLAQVILAALFAWIGTNFLGIAVWAHIGGFAAGIALGFVFRAQDDEVQRA
jgi:membrane associated rhomboid family serine protease